MIIVKGKGDFMKFGDKLIELRKKKGYSQEELAEKLGVSRQSVSKWESNNTYPETDKIIQIANIFECSMDDLINDEITDVEGALRKNKNNITNIWDSLLDFITKTVNMFSKMTFASGLKCIIELAILTVLLWLLGKLVCSVTSSVIANLFVFISSTGVTKLREILYGIFHLIWLIIEVITIIYTFKIRYLDFFTEEKITEAKPIEKKRSKIEKKSEPKIIVRDENSKPFAFLGVLSKIVLFFIKFIVFWILFSFVFLCIGLVISGVISIAFIFTNIIFLWIFLGIFASTAITIQIIILLFNFIFNRKSNMKLHLIVFLISVVLFGTSIGLTALSVKNIEFVDDSSKILNLEKKEIKVDYQENLVIRDENNDYEFIIDDTLKDNEIYISKLIDKRYSDLTLSDVSKENNVPIVYVWNDTSWSYKEVYDLYVKNLKNNKIYTLSDYGKDPLVIRANEETTNRLIDNLKIVYLLKETDGDGKIIVNLEERRVKFNNWYYEGEYDAINDTITYSDNDDAYHCEKEIESTKLGDKIIYNCDYNYEEE